MIPTTIKNNWLRGWVLVLILTFMSVSSTSAQVGVNEIQGPFASDPVAAGVSVELRSLATEDLWQPGDPFRINPRRLGDMKPTDLETRIQDPLVASGGSSFRTPALGFSFDGISSTGYVPPDTVGDVGPNHYVQMVNSSFSIFDKTGNLLTGPVAINSLWTGQNNQCEFNNDGDPIVLYDPLANRWLLSQFAIPGGADGFHICMAVSQTDDPTGAYFLYDFQVSVLPDYLKFAVWPDAYYMSTNEGFSKVGMYAFDRTEMLLGNPATGLGFTTTGNFMLPSDVDGASPPTGSPNFFYRMMDDTFWPVYGNPGVDRLEIFEFHVDFSTPANSTFTLTDTLPTATFNYTVCGWFDLTCIPQPAPGVTVDAISEWPMWRLQYRNFGTHDSLVGTFTVDVDGTNHAGLRWFELRKTSGSWSIFQEGTHAPDGDHRWLGSIAMDKDGNIAIGYSVSSTTLFPSIRYATRLASDPPRDTTD